MASSSGAPPANPQQVRKKWDALLSVINGGASAEGAGEPAKHAQSARELLEESVAKGEQSFGPGSSSSPGRAGGANPRRRKPQWNDRHHLVFSVVNGQLQKNVRSYFDRTRDIEGYGLRFDQPLKNEWQLDYGTDQTYDAKMMEKEALPEVKDPRGSKGMTKSASAPGWDSRHQVLFNKDNHHYHPNYRDYFNKPRELLW